MLLFIKHVKKLKNGKLSELYKPERKRHPHKISIEIEEIIRKTIKDEYPSKSPKLIWRNFQTPDQWAGHERIDIGYMRLYRLMRRLALWKKHKSKSERDSKKHKSRPKAGQYGELVQVDACQVFLPNDEKGNLYCFIDDATQYGFIALYRPGGESYANWADAIRIYIETFGVPGKFYMDRFSAIKDKKDCKKVKTELRQYIESLGVEVIFASGPQAKGRIERRHKTSRDYFNDKTFRAGRRGHEINANLIKDILRTVNDQLEDLVKKPRKSGDLHKGEEHIRHLLKSLHYIDLQMLFARRKICTVRKGHTLQMNSMGYTLDCDDNDIPLNRKVTALIYSDGRVVFQNDHGKLFNYLVCDLEQKYCANILAEDVIMRLAKSPKETLNSANIPKKTE